MSRPAGPDPESADAPAQPAPLAPVGPGRFILTARCREEIRRAIWANPRILLIGRASNNGGAEALELAVNTVYTGAGKLEDREGIRVIHLLPADREVLKAHHRAAGKVMKNTDAAGRPFTVRWSVWTAPDSGLTVLLVTGSGTKVDHESLDQPTLKRAGLITQKLRPAVVYAQSLTRIGRGYPAALFDALDGLRRQMDDGPFLGDGRMPLTEPTMAMKVQVAVQGLAAEDEAHSIVDRNQTGSRDRTGKKHPTLAGVWEFGTNRIPPPGLTTLSLRTDDHPTPWNALVLDCPEARPKSQYIHAGLQPPLIPGTDTVADQVALVRWLGEHLYVGEWDAQTCAVELARQGWAPMGLRYRRPMEKTDNDEIRPAPAVRLRAGYDGRNNGRDALRAFLNNLDFYETGDLVVQFHGQQPKTITGVLPLDGKPWITEPQARRIRQAEARRHSGPKDRHLFAALPVTVDGQPAELKPRYKRRTNGTGELVYYFDRPGGRGPVTSPRADAVPPVPAAALAQWYAHALAGLALPLSLQLADRPADPDSWQARVDVLDAEVRQLNADLKLHNAQLKATDPDTHPTAYAHVTDLLEETGQALRSRQEELDTARHQAQAHADTPVLDGAPLARLVELAAALQKPKDDGGHRGLLLDELTESLVVETTRRISTGKRPAYDLHATLTLQIQDGTDSWRAVSEHSWTGGCAIERTPARIAEAIDGLYAGVRLRQKLGADWMQWLPAIRAALACTGRFSFATADDARLLRLGMAVIHPRRSVVGMPADPEEIPRYAGPPVDPAELPALARRLREPVALLRAIRASYAKPVRTWLRDESPAIAACYAAAARNGGAVPLRAMPGNLRPRADGTPGPHPLSREWTRTRDEVAELERCRCGSPRRAVMLLREVTGTLCLKCRTDRAGVLWDSGYDRYIDIARQPAGVQPRASVAPGTDVTLSPVEAAELTRSAGASTRPATEGAARRRTGGHG